MKPSKIYQVKSTYNDVYENLKNLMSSVESLKIADFDSITLKFNTCGARTADSAAITHPLFVEGVIRFLRDRFGKTKIYAVESDATTAQPDLLVRWLGFDSIFNKWNVKYLNLSREKANVQKINGRYFSEILVPEVFDNSYFITLPKLKTNLASSITCCLKNQFGCLPEARKVKYHKNLDDVIVDCNLAMKPHFCIVDAVTAMGGALGPGLGTPIPFGAIICGSDAVAIDTYCAKLVGFNAWRVGHIRKAATSGLGTMRFQVIGDTIPKVDFETSKLRMGAFKMGSRLQKMKKKSN